MVKIWCDLPGVFIDARFDDFTSWPSGATGSFGRSAKGLFPATPILVAKNKLAANGKVLDYFKHGSMLMVSKKLKEIIELEGASAEFFDIRVLFRAKTFTDYFFMNILEVSNCLDHQKTNWADTGIIRHIKHLALDCDRITNSPLFRIADTVFVGASDKLVKEIESAGCTGVLFKSPEDWKNIALCGE